VTPVESDLGSVPVDWDVTQLGSLLREMRNGTTATQNTEGRGLAVTRIETISSGRVDYSKVRHVDASEETLFRLEPGDVLFSHINSVSHIGKVARFRGERPLYHGMNLMLLRFDASQIDPLFGFLCLGSRRAKAFFEARCKKAINQASLNRGDVGALRMPLPPLPEQRKIAAILSSIDDAIEAAQAVTDQVQVLKKAMMAELLTRGIPGRHTKFKMTEIGEVPEDWEVVRAGDVCDSITKGATPQEQTRDAGEIPFLKVYNIDPGGFIDFDYQPTFIPRSVHEAELRRSRVASGDVLMNIVGPPLGKVAIVPPGFPQSNINQAIAVFRASRVESAFLAMCLRAPHLFEWASARAKRTSTQLNLTLELCRDYPIPLPSPSERAHIVAVLGSVEVRLHAESDFVESLRRVKAAFLSVLLTGEVRVKTDEEAA
jgi:type I restriction enzyme S subunit